MPERSTILVTDAGLPSSIAFLRSLGRRGWKVIAADAHRSSLGFRSRYASETLVYPSPIRQPAEFVACIADAIRTRRVDLVIPVTDAAILPLSAQRSQLPATCQVAMPEPHALDLVTDKDKTLALAERLGIPAPRSVRVDTVAAATQAAAEFGWPVVLKPKSSRIYRDGRSIESYEVMYASGPEDLAARLGPLEGRCEILVQEYCAGAGHGIGMLTEKGRVLAAFQHRRIHEFPLSGGVSSLRESVPLDPALLDYASRLLAAVDWTGLAMVEFKVGPKGPKLMEVNGRVWGSLPLAVLSGVDFPRGLVELYLGPRSAEAAPQLRYRTRVKARKLELDVVWIAAALGGHRKYPFLPAPSRAEGLVGLLQLLDPRCSSDLWALDDPGPALGEFPRVFTTLWQKYQKHRD